MIGSMMMNKLGDYLNEMIPHPRCELAYNKDYELLIATVLSAQTTDARVNMVTKELWSKYDIYSLAQANINDVERIIKPIGTYHKKAEYIINIANKLVNDYQGHVPNNRLYIESLPGAGHKTCNVVLYNIYNVPTMAVDTHVARVSKRLGIVSDTDDVLTIEKKLQKYFPEAEWGMRHHQLVLFGRYICKAKNPDCTKCLLKEYCKYKNSSH
jgi:endonuclease-3